MCLGAVARRMVACLLNISEARNRDVVDKVARAAVFHKHGGRREGSTVLNIFNDHDYNRSVITIVASIDDIGDTALAACEQALDLIDFRGHEGAHPCMGAVDLVPLYPLGQDVGLEECGREARELAGRLTQRIPGTAAFYFGMADDPRHRGLAQRRKEVGWFRNNPDLSRVRPDVVGGTPESRYGLTGVGASPYVMNCNVTLSTQDLSVGRRVAASLRESSPGGIPGVQALALPHEGVVEIACNVESVPGAPPADHWPTFTIRGQQFCHAPASLISTHVEQLAGQYGIVIKGSVLVGFTPQECKDLAVQAIAQGIGEYWKHQRAIFM